MNLYCESCNKLHWIPDDEVEALVYALEAESRGDPARVEIDRAPASGVLRVIEHRPEPDEPTCLEALVSLAFDSEGYGEHVQANKDRRRELERRRSSVGGRS